MFGRLQGGNSHLDRLPRVWEISVYQQVQDNPKSPYVDRRTIVALGAVQLWGHVARCSPYPKHDCSRLKHTRKAKIGDLKDSEVVVQDVFELLDE